MLSVRHAGHQNAVSLSILLSLVSVIKKKLNKSNLEDKDFFQPTVCGYSPSWQRNSDIRSLKQLVIWHAHQDAEKDGWSLLLSSFSPLTSGESRTPDRCQQWQTFSSQLMQSRQPPPTGRPRGESR